MSNQKDKLMQLLDSSGPRLHALLLRLTLREDIAEELMQELFIKLNHANGFHRADNPYAYAYRSAINLASDWRRTQKQNLPPLDLSHEPAARTPSPLTQLIQAEQLEQILDATALVTPLLRDAFVMRHIQQESYETIAGRLGKTSHQIRALCAKALTQLRHIINQKPRP